MKGIEGTKKGVRENASHPSTPIRNSRGSKKSGDEIPTRSFTHDQNGPAGPPPGDTATATNKRSSKFIAQLIAYIAGIEKHYTTPTNLPLNGGTVSTTELVTEFQGAVDADANAKAEDKKRQAAIAAANAAANGTKPRAKAFKSFLLGAFAGNPTALADFALEERKQATLTSAERSAAAKKAFATRQALGTKGSKQKKLAKKALAEQQAPEAPAPEAAPAAPAAPTAPTATPAKS